MVPAVGEKDETVLDVEEDTTIGEIRRRVAKLRDIPADILLISYKGFQLDDAETIGSIGIIEGEVLYLLIRTEGGL